MPEISKGKVIASVSISAILEVGVLCLSDITSLAQQYKIPNLKKEMIVSSLQGLKHHPIALIASFVKAKNPIFFIGTCLVLIIFLRLIFNSGKKSSYEIESKYAIHGSSRYSNNNEIFVEGQTVGVPTKQLYEDLIESMGGKEHND